MQMMVIRPRGGGEGGLGDEGAGGGAETQRKQLHLVFLLTLLGGGDINPDLASDLVTVPRTTREG